MSSPKRHAALAVSPTITAAVGPDEPVLDVDDIQGNILAGFNKYYQSYLFLRIKNVKRAKEWIRKKLAPRLASTSEVLAFNRLYRAAREAHGAEHLPVKAVWINAGFSAVAVAKLVPAGDAGTSATKLSSGDWPGVRSIWAIQPIHGCQGTRAAGKWVVRTRKPTSS